MSGTGGDGTAAAAGTPGGAEVEPKELVERAAALMRSGHVTEARGSLDEAARRYEARGDRDDAASSYAFAAGLRRLEGDLDGAYERANRAGALAGDDRSTAAAQTELGEVLLATGRWPDAAAALARAVVHERDPARLVRLLRRRATALFAGGSPRGAGFELGRAAALATQAGDRPAAARALVERATVLTAAGTADAADARAEAEAAATALGDRAALTSLGLLRSGAAVAAGDLDGARAEAAAAREAALTEVDPVAYVASAVALSRLAELVGDDLGAYDPLATGWATLGDLAGPDLAGMVFRPHLADLRDRLGATRFAAAKEAYEERRRTEEAMRAMDEGGSTDQAPAGGGSTDGGSTDG